METRSTNERRRIDRAALVAFLAGLAPASVPFWAAEADGRTKGAFLAAGLACWAIALLIRAGMDAPRASEARNAREIGGEELGFRR